MKTNIAMIGDGNVGSALARGLQQAGHEVRAVGRDPQGVRDAAAWGDVVILAVPYGAMNDVVREAGKALAGKPVVDVSNVLDSNRNLALGFTTSGAEELQKMIPGARVVKAFNTIFAQHMDTGRLGGEPLAAFVAGDDGEAKGKVMDLARDIGFDPVDAGPLRNSRLLEPMGYLNIQMAYGLGMGPKIGFRLQRG